MDLNLLRVLDALLQESSVTRAAERLGTSPAAVSRTLARLRRAVGDPLLVRAGQGMVPTPRAEELRDEVGALLRGCDNVLRPGTGFDAAHLQRTFTVQANDLILVGLAKALTDRVHAHAPGVDVVFLPEAWEGGPGLRQGAVDLELGVLDHLDPEIRTRSLTRVSLVGVARSGHPLFDGTGTGSEGGPERGSGSDPGRGSGSGPGSGSATGGRDGGGWDGGAGAVRIDARRFAEADHIGISRQGKRRGPIDAALGARGLRRRVAVVVPSHTSALLLARDTDLVALTLADWLPGTLAALGLRAFPLPLELGPLELGMAWHPRNSSDPGHRWLRDHVADAVHAPDG